MTVDRTATQNAAAILGALAAAIGLIGLLGLIFHISLFSSIIPGYQAMAFGTSLILMLFGAILVLGSLRPFGDRAASAGKTTTGVVLLAVAIAGASELPTGVLGKQGIVMTGLVRIGDFFAGSPTSAISPGTLVLVIATAAGLFLLTFSREDGTCRTRHAAGLIGLAVALGGFTFALSYVYQTSLLYGTGLVPIALPTAIAICFLGAGITAAAGPAAFPLAALSGTGTRARLLRAFLPLTFLIVIATGIATRLITVFFPGSGAILTAACLVAFSLIIGAVISRTARQIGGALDEEERRRVLAEENLHRKTADLEAAYEEITATEEELRKNYEELAKSEKALRESENRYRELFDNIPVGVSRSTPGPGGKILDGNPAVLRIFEAESIEELLAIPPENLYADPGERRRFVAEMLQKGTVAGLEVRYNSCRGRTFWGRIGSKKWVAGDGSLYFANTVEDITEKKEAEAALIQKTADLEAAYEDITAAEEELRKNYEELAKSERELRESEARYRLISENTADVIWLLDPVREWFTYVSPSVERLRGYTPKEVLGQKMEEVMTPASYATIKNELPPRVVRFLAGDESERTTTSEIDQVCRDGTIVPTEVVTTILTDKKGNITQVLGVTRNISDRKQAEHVIMLTNRIYQLAQKEESLSGLLNAYVALFKEFSGCEAVGIRLLDKDGNIPYQAQSGFPAGFYEKERFLNVLTDACMCTHVIQGKVSPDLPVATPGGSFYCNGTRRFLATVSEEDKGRTRNVCSAMGYESVALIPLRTRQGITGLIQLNDHRENRVPLELVKIIENVALPLGEAIRTQQAEDALRESESRYRSLFENMTDGFVLFGVIGDDRGVPADLRILAGNHGFETTTGLKMQDVTGKLLTEVLPGIEHDAADWIKTYGTVALTGQSRQFEQGSELLGFYYLVTAYQAAPGHCAVVFSDITDRKKAEAALKESEERFRQFFTENQAVMLMVEPASGKIIDANPAAAAFYGYSRTEICTKNISEINMLDPKEVDRLRQQVSEGSRQSFVAPHRLADGTIRTVEVHSSGIRAGDRTYLYSIVHDVTEREATKAALMESEERFRDLFEKNYTVMLEIDPGDGRILDANPAASAFYGYPREILCRMKVPDIDTLPGKEIAGLLSRARDGGLHLVQVSHRLSNGTIRTVEIFTTPVITKGRTRLIALIHDITGRKQAEKEREAMIHDLEEKNAEMERFVYTISHDLKTPLITIMGYAGLLEEDLETGKTEDLRACIDRITSAGKKMDVLLADVLQLSRIGRVISPQETISMAVIAREAADLVAISLQQRGVQIGIDPEMPAVHVDRNRIREVLVNLIENAVKYMGNQKDPVIRIGVDRQDNTPVFFVRDNGMGLNPAYLERIFTLFEKIDPKSPGTGAGLAIVKRIIEVHGGKIWAESKGEGMGSTFFFTLPPAEP